MFQRMMVTGGAGFIGSNFIRYQLDTYPDLFIVNYDKLTYAGNLKNVEGIDTERYLFVKGDIADSDTLRNAMQGCNAVVNFAADSHVDRSILGATTFIETNVTGVYHLMECVRDCAVQRVLHVSTDEVYGSIETGSCTEQDPVRPGNPYSASKAGGELIALSHFRTFGTPVIITRGSNTYGPYQYPEKVLPLFITNALEGKQLPLYKGGEHNVRDWLYVQDHVRGIDYALRQGQPGEVYNIAGGNEQENIVLTHTILNLLGFDEDRIDYVKDRPGHDKRYSIDATKMHQLGWAPCMDWDTGIASTVQWYIEHENWWRPIKSGEFLEYYRRQYER